MCDSLSVKIFALANVNFAYPEIDLLWGKTRVDRLLGCSKNHISRVGAPTDLVDGSFCSWASLLHFYAKKFHIILLKKKVIAKILNLWGFEKTVFARKKFFSKCFWPETKAFLPFFVMADHVVKSVFRKTHRIMSYRNRVFFQNPWFWGTSFGNRLHAID